MRQKSLASNELPDSFDDIVNDPKLPHPRAVNVPQLRLGEEGFDRADSAAGSPSSSHGVRPASPVVVPKPLHLSGSSTNLLWSPRMSLSPRGQGGQQGQRTSRMTGSMSPRSSEDTESSFDSPMDMYAERSELVRVLNAVLTDDDNRRHGSHLASPSTSSLAKHTPPHLLPQSSMSDDEDMRQMATRAQNHMQDDDDDDDDNGALTPKTPHVLGSPRMGSSSSIMVHDRTVAEVAAASRDFSNPFRERDALVLCLMDSERSSVQQSLSSFGSGASSTGSVDISLVGPYGFPRKVFRALDEWLEQRCGPNHGAILFASLWDERFAVKFCLNCFLRAQREDSDRMLMLSTACLMNAIGRIVPTLKLAITWELDQFVQEQSGEEMRSTLFRSNSISTGLFSAIYHNGPEGCRLLSFVVGPIVKTVLAMRNVMAVTDSDRLKTILSSFFANCEQASRAGILPSSMVETLQHLCNEVSRHSPSIVRSVLCVFLFVRFLCPVIVSPHAYSLCRDPPNGAQQKNLVLVSKLLSNVASNVRFDGTKEERMSVLNGMIDYFGPTVERWLDLFIIGKPTSIAHVQQSSDLASRLRRGTLASNAERKLDLAKSIKFLLVKTSAWYDDYSSTLDYSEKAKLGLLGHIVPNIDKTAE